MSDVKLLSAVAAIQALIDIFYFEEWSFYCTTSDDDYDKTPRTPPVLTSKISI